MIIDKQLISLNEYSNKERTNKYIAAKVKRDETKYCEICSRNQLKPVLSYPTDILIVWYTKGRKDHDNVSFAIKFILDGMVNAGILKNDNPKHVKNIYHQFKKDTKDYCEVTLGQFEISEFKEE